MRENCERSEAALVRLLEGNSHGETFHPRPGAEQQISLYPRRFQRTALRERYADSRRHPDQRDLAYARVRAAPSRQSDCGLAFGATQGKAQSKVQPAAGGGPLAHAARS